MSIFKLIIFHQYVCCLLNIFEFPAWKTHANGFFTFTSEGMHKVVLCLALMALKQEGLFIA